MFLATTGVLLTLSLITVSLRLFCRITHVHHVGLDDYFVVVALIVALGMGVQNGFHVSWGTGQHGADLPFDKILTPTLKHWYAYQLVYPWSLFFVKASILALYHRIFAHSRRFRYYVYGVTAFVTTYTIVVFFVHAFECRDNPSQAWSPNFPKGCNDLPKTYFSTASINILTDAIILIMPLRAFSQLNLHRRKRFALLGVFMVGGIAVIASIIRLYALWVYNTTKDVAYDAIFILLLSQIEVNVAIISASAPALRPLFNKTFLSLSYNRSSKYGRNSSTKPTSQFSGGNRSRSNGQMELPLFSKNEPIRSKKSNVEGVLCNKSDEYISQQEGITKTVRIDLEVGLHD